MAENAQNRSKTRATQDIVQPPWHVKPPLIGLALIATGVIAHLVAPLAVLPTRWLPFIVGLLLIGGGLAVVAASAKTFARFDTDDRFEAPTSTIVTEGPYSKSRNPMYVGAITTFVGVALAVNSLWILVLALVWIGYLWFGVVRREESYLSQRFGEAYTAYSTRVRRWV